MPTIAIEYAESLKVRIHSRAGTSSVQMMKRRPRNPIGIHSFELLQPSRVPTVKF